jgi:L-lysine 6-transaminase
MNTLSTLDVHDVHDVLRRHVLVDGYDFVLDLDRSRGSWLVDARTGDRYLDMFGFFSSAALGLNPPQLTDAGFLDELARAAVHKPSNPDTYTVAYARFVETFARVLGDPALPHLFFIDGGALAVENALKAAFDWKWQRLGAGADPGLSVLHLTGAFHGRSGYTLSVTNTDPAKTARFPRFDWPRVPAPVLRFPLHRYADANEAADHTALAAAEQAFTAAAGNIACFLAEPIQGEGGDNHLSAGFLLGMQELCHRHDALFVLDEVQTGVGACGSAWAYQQLGLAPDIVAFGKKAQVCGVMAGRRVDVVPGNVFRVSSRISSTWGGNLADMVRATRMLEVIEHEELFGAAARLGRYLVARLDQLVERHPDTLANARGRGLLCAIDVRDRPARDALLKRLYQVHRVIALPCGETGIRFRPALTVTEGELGIAVDALACAVDATP